MTKFKDFLEQSSFTSNSLLIKLLFFSHKFIYLGCSGAKFTNSTGKQDQPNKVCSDLLSAL